MTIQVRLGLGLDGAVLAPYDRQAGFITGGPNQILEWLESQVGLAIPNTSFPERSLQYLSCLKSVQSEPCFFSSSLEVDPIAVSNKLLKWRDQWYLAAWDGRSYDTNSDRLNCLINDVEPIAKDVVSLNEGQRLQRLIELEAFPIDLKLSVIDSPDAWPLTWRLLFEKLGASYEKKIPKCVAEPNSDLFRLQQALVNEENEELELNGDGSIVIIKAPSRSISANWLADQFDNPLGAVPSLLVESDGNYIDVALQSRGLPQLSLGATSVLRPIFQVLPLSMSLIWKPLNPLALLQFLAHPVGPLPKRVRKVLAKVVAVSPGIGSEKWKQAIEDLKNEQHHFCDKKSVQDNSQQLVQSIKFWLEPECYDPIDGAPLTAIEERVHRLLSWVSTLQKNMQGDTERDEEIALYRQAAGHLKGLIQAVQFLSEIGQESITFDELLRIIGEVQGSGTPRPDIKAKLTAECIKTLYATHPSAVITEQNHLIWWGADNHKQFNSYGWTLSEQQQLHEAGIEILSDEECIKWNADSWLQPIFQAKNICFVIHHDSDAEHPILDLVRSRTKQLPEYELLDIIQGKEQGNNRYSVTTSPERLSPLQTPQRFWKLPSTVNMPKRAEESYSSLEKFLYGPYMWVLKYSAEISTSALLKPKDGSLLLGSLSHKLFEEFFKDTDHQEITSITRDEIEIWGRVKLLALISSCGAQLFMPGRAAEREKFVYQTIRALQVLVKHLQAADVEKVILEHNVKGFFSGGSIGGSIDLIARRADGQEAIIDMKWGGANYRKKSLEDSTCMQLAIYSELRKQEINRTADVGYFIIQSAELMMQNSDFFPDAESILPKNGESMAELWQRIDHSWKHRRQELDNGEVEVPVSGTELMNMLKPDEKLLPLPDTYESFSEFTALVGWEESS